MRFDRERRRLAGCITIFLLSAVFVLVSLGLALSVLRIGPGETRRVAVNEWVAPLNSRSATTPSAWFDSSASQSIESPLPGASAEPLAGLLADQPATSDRPTQTPDNAAAQAGPAGVASATETGVQPTLTPGSPLATQPPTPALTPSPPSPVGVSPLPTPTTTPTPTSTSPASNSGRISGRLLLNGLPVNGGVTLKLENQASEHVAETRVAPDGSYTFEEIPPSAEGYNLLFYQETNPQYELGQVISWGWLGPIVVAGAESVNLPELDIALLGLRPVSPEPNASLSAGTPITFEWSAYPQATTYWVDLVQGEEMRLIWKSALLQTTSVTFDGQAGGGRLEPGEYWWGIGAKRNLDDYTLIVYGYLPVLQVTL